MAAAAFRALCLLQALASSAFAGCDWQLHPAVNIMWGCVMGPSPEAASSKGCETGDSFPVRVLVQDQQKIVVDTEMFLMPTYTFLVLSFVSQCWAQQTATAASITPLPPPHTFVALGPAKTFAACMALADAGGRSHRVDPEKPEFASRPSSLTGNPYIKALELTQILGGSTL
jgi:hypothetical protein